MGIFDFFSKKKSYAKMQNEEKISHLKNLIAVAISDGKVDEEEFATLVCICEREGLAIETINDIIKDPNSVEYVKPTDYETKIQYLRDMVSIMMVDGDIDKKELALCKLTALNLGFKHEIIDAMIVDIIKYLEKES